MGQKRIQKPKSQSQKQTTEVSQNPEEDVSQSVKKAEELKSDMDDILDEIDAVLEENAAEFIAGFIQKGGQ